MTTIAYKDRVLATDTACICNGVYEGRISKAMRCLDSTIVAVSGDAANLPVFQKWIEGGSKNEDRPKISDEFSAIVVRPSGAVRNYDHNLVPLDITASCFAIGSGKDIALGAMLAGMSAWEAVKIACRHDVWSREPCEQFDVLGVPKKANVTELKGGRGARS